MFWQKANFNGVSWQILPFLHVGVARKPGDKWRRQLRRVVPSIIFHCQGQVRRVLLSDRTGAEEEEGGGEWGGEGEPSSSVSLLPRPVAAALAGLRCSLFSGFQRILVLSLSRSLISSSCSCSCSGGLLESVADFVASCLLWCDTNAAFLFATSPSFSVLCLY